MRGKGGGKRKNKSNDPMVFMEEGETIYGQVVAALGASRFSVLCVDTVTRRCKLRGNMLKTVWVQSNDIVLVSLRPDNNDIGDICKKYQPHEVKILRQSKLIPEDMKQDAGEMQPEFEFQKI
jgi:initiation factor 1A